MLAIVVFVIQLDIAVLEVFVLVGDGHDAENASQLLSLGGKLEDDLGS